jgi:hypothetical protein
MKIHIAGFPVQIGTKYRQRCAWCEVVLLDGDGANEMVAPGSDPVQRFWELGALVAVEGNGSWTVKDEGERLPTECCGSQRPKLRAVETK